MGNSLVTFYDLEISIQSLHTAFGTCQKAAQRFIIVTPTPPEIGFMNYEKLIDVFSDVTNLGDTNSSHFKIPHVHIFFNLKFKRKSL